MPRGMAIRKPTFINALAAIETRLARIIAYGVTARGSWVSSARSAAPSHPMKQYIGSKAARTKPYQRAPPDVRCVETRMWKPALWWKKNMEPTTSTAAATTEPTISKTTPTLFTALTARMLMILMRAATAITTAASSTMSPWEGDFQISLAKTDARATAVAAVPAMNASSAVYPVNQP